MTGTGTFINNGRFEMETAGSFGLLLYNGSPTFENNGDFVFTQNKARLQLGYNVGDTPVFQNNGTVEVNLPSTSDYVTIQTGRAVSSLGQFLTTNPIKLTKGALVFAAPNVTNMDDATFNALFSPTTGSINTNSEVRLAGELQTIHLTAAGIGAANLAQVSLGQSGGLGESLAAAASGTTINVQETDGGIWLNNVISAGTPTLSIDAGRTMTNVAGSLIKGGTNTRIIGSGEFINNGKFTVSAQDAGFGLLLYNGSPTFTNSATGDVILTGSDSSLELGYGATDAPVFQNNGNLEVALPSTANIAYLGPGHAASTLGEYHATQGIKFTQGTLVFAPPNVDSYTDANFNSLFGPLNTSSELRLAGTIQTIHLTAAGIGAGNLAQVSLASDSGTNLNLTAHPLGTSIDVPEADGGIHLNNLHSTNNPTIAIPSGRTMTNEVGSLIIGGRNNRIIGAGEFINKGKFTLSAQTGGFGLLLYNSSPTFTNQGEFVFTENTAELKLGNTGADSATFTNTSDGIVRVNLPSGTNTATIEQAGSGTFNNNGAVEVLSGTLRFDGNVNVPAVTGGGSTLSAGQWSVISTGNAATLDLRAGGTSAGSITTIGAGAKVVLSADGGTADFLQLGSISTLQGELYVHNDYVQAVGASPMNVTGTLGGDGTYNAVDSIVFTGGKLDPAALDGTAGTMTINGDLILNGTNLKFALGTPGGVGSGLNDLVEVNGALTLDGTLNVLELPGFGAGRYRLFNYNPADGLTLGNVVLSESLWSLDTSVLGQVDLVIPVPEPATFWLLSLGAGLLTRRKRKAHAQR